MYKTINDKYEMANYKNDKTTKITKAKLKTKNQRDLT